MSDKITLNIPAKADYLLTARLAASSIGARMGFDLNDIEDIKTATAEAILIVLQEGKSKALDVIFYADDNELKVEVLGVSGETTRMDTVIEDNSLGKYLLEALADEVEIKQTDSGITSVNYMKRLQRQ